MSRRRRRHPILMALAAAAALLAVPVRRSKTRIGGVLSRATRDLANVSRGRAQTRARGGDERRRARERHCKVDCEGPDSVDVTATLQIDGSIVGIAVPLCVEEWSGVMRAALPPPVK